MYLLIHAIRFTILPILSPRQCRGCVLLLQGCAAPADYLLFIPLNRAPTVQSDVRTGVAPRKLTWEKPAASIKAI
jgi:hypothetical protein